MKKFIRLTSWCLAILMVAAIIPFQAIAAVSVPANVKSVVFDATYYANKYSDLKAAFGTDATKLYNHFLNNGIKEGRQASPMFSVDYYLKNNADLKAAFGSNRESAFNHFLKYGVKEPRFTAPAVDLGTGIDVRISMNSGGGKNLDYSDTNVCTAAPVLKAVQTWRLDRQSDGSYKITNNATGKVLDVYAGSRASGANVGLYASNDTNAQRWFIYKNTNNTYTIRAKCGTTCALSVNGNSTAAGANVQMNTYNGASGQQFRISKISVLESMEPENIGSNFWGNIRGAEILPENTTYKEIEWSVSKEGIASIDENGVLTANATGIVIVTAEAKSGVTETIEIEVYSNAGDTAAGIIGLAAISGGGAAWYYRRKKKKEAEV